MQKPFTTFLFSLFLISSSGLFTAQNSLAQTPADGLMMSKGSICTVALYSRDSWEQYWEGPLKRQNANIGTVATESFHLMAAAGITKKLNLIMDLPYVRTHISAGTLRGMRGVQDLSMALKWQAYTAEVYGGKFSAFGVAGFSTPLGNYVKDYLPASIGFGSTTGSLRGTLHYKTRIGFFVTANAGYTRRSNIQIDRNSYFTDRMVYSDEVWMPNVADGSVRAGFLNRHVQAEAILSRFTTLGGFDITRNNMPFPSNLMQATRLGVNAVYRPGYLKNFSFNAGASYATHGRNVGQSSMVYGGLQYVFRYKAKSQSEAPDDILSPRN
jgi:hypothetical protein